MCECGKHEYPNPIYCEDALMDSDIFLSYRYFLNFNVELYRRNIDLNVELFKFDRTGVHQPGGIKSNIKSHWVAFVDEYINDEQILAHRYSKK